MWGDSVCVSDDLLESWHPSIGLVQDIDEYAIPFLAFFQELQIALNELPGLNRLCLVFTELSWVSHVSGRYDCVDDLRESFPAKSVDQIVCIPQQCMRIAFTVKQDILLAELFDRRTEPSLVSRIPSAREQVLTV